MKFSTEFAKSLPFRESATLVLSKPLLDMPQLVSERALADNADLLASAAESLSIAGHTPAMEVIGMPKKSYGQRPIGVLSPVARTIYESVVGRLGPALPAPSRDQGFEAHRSFGLTVGAPEGTRIVDADIAACYEYVDHQILADEILLQGLDSPATDALKALLGDLFPRRVGIPQGLAASHLLADAYLARMQRGLLRAGYTVNRFADDFRLVAPDWPAAHRAIELIVEEARAIGLTLADGKTRIHSIRRLQEDEQARKDMFEAYRERAADDLRSMEFVSAGYEDWDLEEVEAPDEDVDFAALKGIVDDWVNSDREHRTLHSTFGSRALRVLRNAPERLPDDWLLEIVTREPRHLRNVMIYLNGRHEQRLNWATLARLTTLPRTSPWARVWMLKVAEGLGELESAGRDEFVGWARSCLADDSEVVRSEAAWVLAVHREVTRDELAPLFISSTSITQCGIAASVGKVDGGSPSK